MRYQRPETNEISLALVPPDHPLLRQQNLQAEADGLLDRALGVLQENSRSEAMARDGIKQVLTMDSDSLLVTATLNGLGGLMRTRATVATRILNAVINFNPFQLAGSPLTAASKLIMRSMEKTVIIFLTHIIKRYDIRK